QMMAQRRRVFQAEDLRAPSKRASGDSDDSDDAENDQCDAAEPRDECSLWADFFEQHKNGQDSDPEQIHYSNDEKNRHKCPTAAEAVGAVVRSEGKRAALAGAPVSH